MLIDEFLGRWDFGERHSTAVNAPTDLVYETVQQVDLAGSWVVRGLFRVRGLSPVACRLAEIERTGFRKLDEVPGREVVFGLIGKFWTASGGLVRFEAGEFRAFSEAGFAKAVCNFAVEPEGSSSRVSTETRVACTDAGSRWRFGAYWVIVRPFSGFIRREVLRAVRKRAESGRSLGLG